MCHRDNGQCVSIEVQFSVQCECWPRSIGGLAVHRCGMQLDTSSGNDITTTIKLRRPGPAVAVTSQETVQPRSIVGVEVREEV